MNDIDWAKVKRSQAHDADSLAAVASGIGEYGVANACYKLAAILRDQAKEITPHSGEFIGSKEQNRLHEEWLAQQENADGDDR